MVRRTDPSFGRKLAPGPSPSPEQGCTARGAFRIPARHPPASDDTHVSNQIWEERVRSENFRAPQFLYSSCGICARITCATQQVRHPTCIPKVVRQTGPCLEWWETHHAGSVAFAGAGLHSAVDAFFPPGAPHAHSAPAAPHTSSSAAAAASRGP